MDPQQFNNIDPTKQIPPIQTANTVPQNTQIQTPPIIPQRQAQHENKNGLLIITIVTIIFIFLIVGGIFAYYLSNNIINKKIELTKDELINIVTNTLNVKSYNFDHNLSLQLKNNDSNKIPRLINLNSKTYGGIDFTNIENLSFDINLNLDIKANLDGKDNASLLADLGLKLKDKSFYFSLKKLDTQITNNGPYGNDAQMLSTMANGFISSIENKWLEIEIKDILSNPTTDIINKTIPEESWKNLSEYITNLNYIKNIKLINNEKIADINTKHFLLTIQGDDILKNILQNISNENVNSGLVTKEKAEKDMEIINNILKQKYNIDIWIGTDDKLIHKIKLGQLKYVEKETDTETVIELDFKLSNHNKSINVEIPEQIIPIKKAMESVFDLMMFLPSK